MKELQPHIPTITLIELKIVDKQENVEEISLKLSVKLILENFPRRIRVRERAKVVLENFA